MATVRRPNLKKLPILKGTLETLRQGIAIFGPDRKLLFVNPAMAEVTGGNRRTPAKTFERLARRNRLRSETGEPVHPKDFPIERAFSGEEMRDQLYLYVEPTGAHIWLSVSCLRIRDDDGSLLYVVAIVSNISEQKSRDDKLRFMQESAKILSITADFHKRLVEKARITVPLLADWCAIDLVEGNGTKRAVVVHQDPKMIDYIYELEKKYPTDHAASSSVYNVIKHMDPQFVPVVTDEILREYSKSEEHFRDLKKLGLGSILVIPISARGKGLGAMTLAYAESGRAYSEEDFQFMQEFCTNLGVLLDNARLYAGIKKRDKAKDLFLASLSHELRNPLAPIKSALEMLRMRDVPQDIREELGVIEHQFDHMARLLNDLLDVTRFTHAKIAIALSRSDLRRLVERALKSVDALLRNADITLHFTYPSFPLQADVDETRMEQAITNLMSNSIKFTPAGGRIWVDVERGAGEALIKIRDNGAGIHPNDLPNIFNMYYQGGHTRDATNTGLGIGLLLVQRIVHLHGGTIEAKSEGLGLGSEFAIHLPLTEEKREKEPQRPMHATSASGKRVLIVDDNIQAAESLARLLNKVGASAETLYSGEETLAHDLSPYHVLLLDVGMPHIDGYELVKTLRTRGITTPIIALTGYGMTEDKQRAMRAGFSAHLTKPIGLKELNETIASVA